MTSLWVISWGPAIKAPYPEVLKETYPYRSTKMNNGKIIKYGVLVQDYHSEIVAEVNKLIAEGAGWQPLGGIEITHCAQFAQAVAQYDTDTPIEGD